MSRLLAGRFKGCAKVWSGSGNPDLLKIYFENASWRHLELCMVIADSCIFAVRIVMKVEAFERE
jgi:hypothetical protein